MKFSLACLTVLLFFSFPGLAWPEEIAIAISTHKPPYVFGEEKRGLEIDIIREALAYKGHQLRVENFSRQALRTAVQLDRVDGGAPLLPVNDQLFYSAPFITYKNRVITKTNDHIVIDSLAALKNHHVVAWQNAHQMLGDDFYDFYNKNLQGSTDYLEYDDQFTQNKMFWSGRANVILIDERIFSWYRTALAKQFDTHQSVTYQNILPHSTSYHVAFKQARIRDDFNDGLKQLKLSKRYQMLYDQYIPPPSTTD